MMKLSSLAQLAIDAAGGLDRWRQFETVSARLAAGGVLWPLKHQQGVLDDVRVRVDLRREWASHRPFGAPDLRTSFQPLNSAPMGKPFSHDNLTSIREFGHEWLMPRQ
jgi:hypothetical protein